jgi:hypothetical protein
MGKTLSQFLAAAAESQAADGDEMGAPETPEETITTTEEEILEEGQPLAPADGGEVVAREADRGEMGVAEEKAAHGGEMVAEAEEQIAKAAGGEMGAAAADGAALGGVAESHAAADGSKMGADEAEVEGVAARQAATEEARMGAADEKADNATSEEMHDSVVGALAVSLGLDSPLVEDKEGEIGAADGGEIGAADEAEMGNATDGQAFSFGSSIGAQAARKPTPGLDLLEPEDPKALLRAHHIYNVHFSSPLCRI